MMLSLFALILFADDVFFLFFLELVMIVRLEPNEASVFPGDLLVTVDVFSVLL